MHNLPSLWDDSDNGESCQVLINIPHSTIIWPYHCVPRLLRPCNHILVPSTQRNILACACMTLWRSCISDRSVAAPVRMNSHVPLPCRQNTFELLYNVFAACKLELNLLARLAVFAVTQSAA